MKHVFIIALTTPGYGAAFGPGSAMKYLDGVLRPKGDLLSGYETLGAASLPDYLAMVSGQAPNPDTKRNCTTYAEFPARTAPDRAGEVTGSGCVYPNTIVTIGDQLDVAASGWKGYFEDLGTTTAPVGTTTAPVATTTAPVATTTAPDATTPAQPQPSCQHPNSDAVDTTLAPLPANDYATSQNPFVYFHSLLDLGDCAKDDLPLTALTDGISSPQRTASLVYIAPGLCDNGSDTACMAATPSGSAAAADAFLKRWVPVVLGSAAYRANGVLLIVFASSKARFAAGAASSHPLRTGALVISRYAKAGSATRGVYTPYSVLRSVEDLFALKALGHAGTASSFATTALPGAWPKTG